MKLLTPLVLVALLLGCRPKISETVRPTPEPPTEPSKSVGTVVAGSGDKPAILEAVIEGVGKAVIEGQVIYVKVPTDYTKSTVRLDYKVTEGVKVVSPASGSELQIRDVPSRNICIQQDQYGNCLLHYQLVIETQSPLTASMEPSRMQLELTQFYQPYEFVFRLGNLKAASPVTRNFKVRLVNKATGYAYTGDNFIVYDLAGKLVIINQLNGPPVPDEVSLRITGTLPLGIAAGDYTVTLQMPTCYSPGSNGECYLLGYESVELPTPLQIKSGPPIVGWVNPVPSPNKEVLITGRNFVPAKPVTVRLTSDFTSALTTQALVINDTLARVPLSGAQVAGQYLVDISPESGKASRTLFTIPSDKASSSLKYVAPLGQYTANMNWFPVLPVFKRGASLEVSYVFTTPNPPNSSGVKRSVKQVRAVSITTNRTYDLQSGGAFTPFAAAPDFYLWKWVLPDTLPTGDYALVFDDFDGTVSLPYYQKIRVE